MVKITVGYLEADFVQFKAETTDCKYYKDFLQLLFFTTIAAYLSPSLCYGLDRQKEACPSYLCTLHRTTRT